jgi:hypothetical protein
LHALGDKVTKYCTSCKKDQLFEVSRISEYGEVFSLCKECKAVKKL